MTVMVGLDKADLPVSTNGRNGEGKCGIPKTRRNELMGKCRVRQDVAFGGGRTRRYGLTGMASTACAGRRGDGRAHNRHNLVDSPKRIQGAGVPDVWQQLGDNVDQAFAIVPDR